MLIIALLCGAGAAVLRAFQLTGSFDPQSALIETGDTVTVLLTVLSAAFAAMVLFHICFRGKGKEEPGKRSRPLGPVWFAAELAALAALAAAAIIGLVKGLADSQASAVCLGALGLLSCGTLLMIALKINKLPFTPVTGFGATVPIFWSCLMMITEFWGHAGNPVRSAYVYGMFSTVFCTLALYAAAGFFFGKVKRGQAFLYILPGIYFAVLTFGGDLLARLFGDPVFILPAHAFFLHVFIALHLAAAGAAILHGRLDPPEKPEVEELTDGEEPDESDEIETEEEGG